MGTPTAPVPTNIPSVKSKESPGRKKPMSRPVSAKMTSMTPRMAQGPNHLTMVVMRLAASSHSGPSIGAWTKGRAVGGFSAGAKEVRAVTVQG